MLKRPVSSVAASRKSGNNVTTRVWHVLRDVCALVLSACTLMLLATACAPAKQPTPTPTPTIAPTPQPTSTAEPSALPSQTPILVATPTLPEPHVGAVEGLVMADDGQLIIGVDWTSKSRVTYVVQGGDVETVLRFLGETARVTGEIVDHGPWLKDISVSAAQMSTAADRLSMRTGFIKELGISIYMQGTHLLTDRDGNTICLLSAKESGLDLDSYMLKGKVAVIGVLTKTVEGDAQIMEVKLVEKIE